MSDRLRYSPQAQLDLDEIFNYFADELGDPQKGQSIVLDMLAAARKIPGRATRFPPVGPLPLTTDEHRFLQVGSYVIFFREKEDEVYVDRVLNNRRDFAAFAAFPAETVVTV